MRIESLKEGQHAKRDSFLYNSNKLTITRINGELFYTKAGKLDQKVNPLSTAYRQNDFYIIKKSCIRKRKTN